MAGQLAAFGYKITGNQICNVFIELSFLEIYVTASAIQGYFKAKQKAIIHCLCNYRYHIKKTFEIL